jgi:integration host factor subunit alpha
MLDSLDETDFATPERAIAPGRSRAWSATTGRLAEGGAVGRDDLAEAAHRQGRVSRRDSRVIVDQVLSEIIDGLATDGVVLLSGFGRFDALRKGERVGRNPKTGEEYPVAARVSVQFTASTALKYKVRRASPRSRRDRRQDAVAAD